ncbi:MAG: hypothetical protein KZQ78_02175 [Candidatus Thiodiazotropha sp. (ex Ustalcina ferruginea)]|nr:hypothetical protein [Candidatus Thiodiazotropha sp. (ex Ustalcina ferruginea)]
MTIPGNKEEFLVWPPMGIGIAAFVGVTFMDAFATYNLTIQNIEGSSVIAAYLFPIAMGIGIAFRLAGKYWLGFGWLAFLAYISELLIKLFSISGVMGNVYTLFISCALMFATQSIYLYFKRFGISSN